MQALITSCQAQWESRWPGMAVSAIVALAALFLAQPYGAPVMLFALLLGMALNFLSQQTRCSEGIDFVARQVLRLGVALLGLRITLAQVQAMGWETLGLVLALVAATIAFGIVMARAFGFQVFFGLLTGGAVAICGASAALALSAALPCHPLKERATLFTVVGVSALSTLAMVLYPMVAQWLHLEGPQAGLFIGATIHDVAQVVGAGYSISHEAGDTATLVKLVRVAMLVPAVLLAAWLARRHMASQPEAQAAGRRPPLLPWFALAFAVLVGVNSTGWLPVPVVRAGVDLSQACLVAAMAAIGMKSHLKEILSVGWKPIALMTVETVFLAALACGGLALLGN